MVKTVEVKPETSRCTPKSLAHIFLFKSETLEFCILKHIVNFEKLKRLYNQFIFLVVAEYFFPKNS
ncbi:hypothetical protein DUT90_00145 [Polaribacter sp. WD7]|nr:hypothetical protein DUT90_00145 [Polaribacter sp. WD7]